MKYIVETHRIATVSLLLIGLTLILTVSPAFRPAITAFLDGAAYNLISEKMYNATIASLIMLMAALSLALHRRDQIIILQEKLLREQMKDIEVNSRAIHDHTVACETNPDGKILDISKSFEQLFEYDREEILGKKIDILYEDDRHDKNYLKVLDVLSGGQTYSGEQRLRTKSGKVVTTLSTIVPYFDEDGNHIKNVSMRTDVTELRRSDAEKYLTALLKKFQDAVYIYTVDTQKILFMNDIALEKSGWSDGEATSKYVHETDSKFDKALFAAHIQPILDGEKQTATAQVWQGSEFVEIVTRLHTLPDETPVFVSVSRDISERKKIESEKLKSVSYVSHELRTPLTSIIGSLKLLKSGAVGDLENKIGSVVDIAERNSERMLEVLNSILDLEKFEAGKMNFTLKPTSLVSLVNSAVEMNKGYGDEHGVSFSVKNVPPIAVVLGSSSHLMQVMSNLMSNAAKFSPRGGDICVELVEKTSFWRISVTDKGPGIPLESQDKVFNSFAQLKPADGKYRAGTGLGLTISKKIVERHSGRIGLVSVVGEGTTFYFDIPKPELGSSDEMLTSSKIAA